LQAGKFFILSWKISIKKFFLGEAAGYLQLSIYSGTKKNTRFTKQKAGTLACLPIYPPELQ
jgi:hypothetical protein